jgi:cycloeucalenol cycloisomerase
LFTLATISTRNGSLKTERKRVGPARWFADDAEKAWTEKIFFGLSAVWMSWFGMIVVTAAYEWFEEYEYMAVGLAMALPYVIVPALCRSQGGGEKKAWNMRYWVKANVWLAIISYVGNYFWTHYFYTLLKAKYTFKSWRLNDVPIAMFLCTHAYFCFYHTGTTLVLRRVWTGNYYLRRTKLGRVCVSTLLVAALAVFTAFMETWTISSFPYYTFENRSYAYTVGSVLYGIYFIVSFPMYYAVDEPGQGAKMTLWQTAVHSLGACMLVTILLDIWRLIVGGYEGTAGGHSVVPPYAAGEL